MKTLGKVKLQDKALKLVGIRTNIRILLSKMSNWVGVNYSWGKLQMEMECGMIYQEKKCLLNIDQID